MEAIALGSLVTKVRKGLPASHVAIDDTSTRVNMPTSVAFKALRTAQALRLQLTGATRGATLHTSSIRD
jgi:hypothetical protein